MLETLFSDGTCFAINRAAHGVLPFPKTMEIYSLDEELSGVVLLANDRKKVATLRNCLGSRGMGFHFLLLARSVSDLPGEISCPLPMGKHRRENRMFISHRNGKKTFTQFEQLDHFRSHTLWSAKTDFPRRHQIRLHAHEVGIPVLGEDLYDQIPLPFLSDFKKHVKPNRKEFLAPLYASICIHLLRIDFPGENGTVTVEAPLPDKWNAMLKIIKKWN
ncbi:MAG: hypothetical protein LBN94_02585 [Puniceicoccales bacterium]|jgi:23S rRNA pseudouridine1911/1915/1917 synthase|nr:hypothetical protein [Puniceicoccales bacterium]